MLLRLTCRQRLGLTPICVRYLARFLYNLGENLNEVNLVNIHPKVERSLSKNGFLSHYGREKFPIFGGTTITYQRLDVDDDRYFSDYIEKEFIHRSEMPDMSPGLLKKFPREYF